MYFAVPQLDFRFFFLGFRDQVHMRLKQPGFDTQNVEARAPDRTATELSTCSEGLYQEHEASAL